MGGSTSPVRKSRAIWAGREADRGMSGRWRRDAAMIHAEGHCAVCANGELVFSTRADSGR